jgi:GH15 family glucan-1,4-alpha-glucosidase
MPLRLEDYALIGDGKTAALVGRDGSIDWLCMPRFDSPACFAALLGTPEHGRWLIAPRGETLRAERHYRPGSLVLETDFETTEGMVTIIDCLPVLGDRIGVVRVVVGRRGRVAMTMDLTLRFDYGVLVPWVRQARDGTLIAVCGPDQVALRTPVELQAAGLHTTASFEVTEGARVPFDLVWTSSHLPPGGAVDVEAVIAATDEHWRDWLAGTRIDSRQPHAEFVRRSLLTLKALTYSPTGGIVAAATTSLPETIGGERNWDYRFCWLRDAALTLRAMVRVGPLDEASAWRDWALRAIADGPAAVRALYGLAGERRLPEMTLPWLPGYEGSAPVRIGNAAGDQLQLDVIGETLDSFYTAGRLGLARSPTGWALAKSLLAHLEEIWREPDDGIWEVRGPRRHFVHSKLMVWVSFDRAVRYVEELGQEGPVEHWREVRSEIFAEICARGFDPVLGSFVQFYGSDAVDASLLLLPLMGFLPPDDPRILGTVAAIERNLMVDGGLLLRYRPDASVEGVPQSEEGAFLACTAWLGEVYAQQGRREEALAVLDRLVGLANDVGLLAEEYDPRLRRQVGNFPQAFSHLALVELFLALNKDETAAVRS